MEETGVPGGLIKELVTLSIELNKQYAKLEQKVTTAVDRMTTRRGYTDELSMMLA